MLKSSLLGREYKVWGNWYDPLDFLKNFKSVSKAGLYNTTSSAGDWEGWLVQKLDKNYLILWSQSNCHGNFTININESPLASWKRSEEFSYDEIEEIIAEHENELAEMYKSFEDMEFYSD